MLESDVLGQVNSDKVLTKTEGKATVCPFVSSDLECTPASACTVLVRFHILVQGRGRIRVVLLHFALQPVCIEIRIGTVVY